MSSSNLRPKIVHIFSVTSTYTYIFKMSCDFTSKSLSAVIINAILTVSLDTASISDGLWCLDHEASSSKPSLQSEVFHFDVEYHTASHKLITYVRSGSLWKDFKCHSDIVHLFWIASVLKIFSFLASMARASSAVLGTFIPNLWFLFTYHACC